MTTQVEFDIKRDKWSRIWRKLEGQQWILDVNNVPWKPDDDDNADEDLTPSATDHIYSIDGPGFTGKQRAPNYDYLAHIGNYREWVIVEIDGTPYQCSDYYKWHTKCYTRPKDGTIDMTRDMSKPQELGSDWITVPINP